MSTTKKTMNTNKRNDPMLSSFIAEDWCRQMVVSPATTPSSSQSNQARSPFVMADLNLLTSEQQQADLSDLSALWSTERKRVSSVKMEDDEESFSSFSVDEEVKEEMDLDDMSVASDDTKTTSIKCEVEDSEYEAVNVMHSENSPREWKAETSQAYMSEEQARRYVEERFEQIAFIPRHDLSQREKIEFILTKSDCREYSVDTILNFNKKCIDSARACAQIVQNIPQRYRWECVQPEDIPCCYTIVADCKKLSSRDKPPRPMNAFMIWAQSARRLINELCPKMQNALISEALGFYWRQKSVSFKQLFEDEKLKLRKFHNVEFPEYKYKPKTKVQKAREKQEMSITKAKMRAAMKLEKLNRAEKVDIVRTKVKTGRPKKLKSETLIKEARNPTHLGTHNFEIHHNESPTKPAIKDMLTMKLLKDKDNRSNKVGSFRSQDLALGVFSQLSPPEVNEYTEELTNVDSCIHLHQDGPDHNAIPSSVFDTPANTPPVDEVHDDLHPSSFDPSLASPGRPRSLSPSTQPPKNSLPDIAPVPSSLQTLKLLPFAASHNMSFVRDEQNVSLLSLLPTSSASGHLPSLHSSSSQQLLDITDLLLTYVSESLSASHPILSPPGLPKLSPFVTSPIDDNNNNSNNNNFNSDINNNCENDLNNNNLDLLTRNKMCPTVLEPSDLDTLFLDLNLPVLSEDDMKCIMNTL